MRWVRNVAAKRLPIALALALTAWGTQRLATPGAAHPDEDAVGAAQQADDDAAGDDEGGDADEDEDSGGPQVPVDYLTLKWTSQTWIHATYEPWNQSYHLAVAADDPTRLASGLQDNGSVRTWTAAAPPSDLSQWNAYGGGDGHEVLIAMPAPLGHPATLRPASRCVNIHCTCGAVVGSGSRRWVRRPHFACARLSLSSEYYGGSAPSAALQRSGAPIPISAPAAPNREPDTDGSRVHCVPLGEGGGLAEGNTRDEIIFDPTSPHPLGTRDIALTAADGVPAGTVLSVTYFDFRIVDAVGQTG
jgi:hypothetical protein